MIHLHLQDGPDAVFCTIHIWKKFVLTMRRISSAEWSYWFLTSQRMHAKEGTVIPVPIHWSYGNEEKCIIRKRQRKSNWKKSCAMPAVYTQIQDKWREHECGHSAAGGAVRVRNGVLEPICRHRALRCVCIGITTEEPKTGMAMRDTLRWWSQLGQKDLGINVVAKM